MSSLLLLIHIFTQKQPEESRGNIWVFDGYFKFVKKEYTKIMKPSQIKTIVTLVIVVLVFILLVNLNPVGQIEAGQRGIQTRFGAVTGTVLNEGIYFRVPFVEKVITMDVRVQKEQVNADAASKDLQTVASDIALNYRVDPSKVAQVYQELGLSYNERLIAPALQEAVKASTAKFTAEELITKRSQVGDDIKSVLKAKLEPRGIIVEDFAIVNFSFSKAFNEAIESKVTAEQNALAARNKLEQIKFEAEQEVAKSKGRAEGITIESEALRNNPQVLELKKIEKWDGKLPQVTGSSEQIINLPR